MKVINSSIKKSENFNQYEINIDIKIFGHNYLVRSCIATSYSNAIDYFNRLKTIKGIERMWRFEWDYYGNKRPNSFLK